MVSRRLEGPAEAGPDGCWRLSTFAATSISVRLCTGGGRRFACSPADQAALTRAFLRAHFAQCREFDRAEAGLHRATHCLWKTAQCAQSHEPWTNTFMAMSKLVPGLIPGGCLRSDSVTSHATANCSNQHVHHFHSPSF